MKEQLTTSLSQVAMCDVCREIRAVTDSIHLACTHTYCGDCLRQFFQNAIADEALFPPRCCQQHIDLEAAQQLLTTKIVTAFNRRQEEINTPDRTYCSSPTCSIFISSVNITDDRALCPQCETITCSICKRAAHEGEDCPEDPALQQLLQIAGERGWQRCLQCKRVVELVLGCNHIK